MPYKDLFKFSSESSDADRMAPSKRICFGPEYTSNQHITMKHELDASEDFEYKSDNESAVLELSNAASIIPTCPSLTHSGKMRGPGSQPCTEESSVISGQLFIDSNGFARPGVQVREDLEEEYQNRLTSLEMLDSAQAGLEDTTVADEMYPDAMPQLVGLVGPSRNERKARSDALHFQREGVEELYLVDIEAWSGRDGSIGSGDRPVIEQGRGLLRGAVTARDWISQLWDPESLSTLQAENGEELLNYQNEVPAKGERSGEEGGELRRMMHAVELGTDPEWIPAMNTFNMPPPFLGMSLLKALMLSRSKTPPSWAPFLAL